MVRISVVFLHFRFARAFPQNRIISVDGSAAMLRWSSHALMRESLLATRVQFPEDYLPQTTMPPQHLTNHNLDISY